MLIENTLIFPEGDRGGCVEILFQQKGPVPRLEASGFRTEDLPTEVNVYGQTKGTHRGRREVKKKKKRKERMLKREGFPLLEKMEKHVIWYAGQI